MCDCPPDVIVGSYKNQVLIEVPPHIELRRNNQTRDRIKELAVDACLELEIRVLWNILQVCTTGCCCGHNTHEPYISVIPEHAHLMREVGYKKHVNPLYPEDETHFVPKSLGDYW